MPHTQDRTPDSLPLLSRGKHRSPRRGACFMELASYLAGERWSDHPACTHPLLASLARHVNDLTSDAARPRLALLIPSVVGLTPTDPRTDARLALLCARTALPVVAEERQRVMAVAVLTCERVLAELDGRDDGRLEPATLAALARVPLAARWAHRFTGEVGTSARDHHRHGAPHTVSHAVRGIAQACVADPDAILHDLLAAAVAECRALVGREEQAERDAAASAEAAPVEAAQWRAVVELTRR